MKKISINGILLGMMILGLTSCEIVGEIFKTGVWFGMVLVILVIFLIFYFLNKGRGGK